MKKTVIVTLILAVAMLAVPAFAAEDGAALFKAKCAACHGPDGTKMAKANLTTTAKSEDEIVTFLTTDAKHKSKVDATSAKALAAFIKSLNKK